MSHRPTVALVVTGSIAAYKATLVARLLLGRGARVVPVMTRSATRFLGPQTLAGLTGEPVHLDMFDASYAGEKHVDLSRIADVVAVVPATADFLARLAEGRADDLATALCLSARGPVLAAPAMHPRMWHHPATARNVATIASDGRVTLVGPVEGDVASGEHGMGRLAEPGDVVDAIFAALRRSTGSNDLDGVRVVVSAGPTVEDLDPVRFVSNRSTGKMGYAIAAAAARRGAVVTLVSGPVSLAAPPGVTRVPVRGALSMRAALWEALGDDLSKADVLVMTAAVGDYRPKSTSETKLKRDERALSLELVPNPDLLAEIGAARGGRRPVLVGFAVETDTDERIVELARDKLLKKRVDLVVANHASDSFGRDDNRAILVEAQGATALGTLSKDDLADRLLDHVLSLATRAG
jgi:phosphopantothenoylcysteine decarboxylase/phosphopantothenate--cysteine ligase